MKNTAGTTTPLHSAIYEGWSAITDTVPLRYIFPGDQLPSNAVFASSIADHTDMQLIGLEDITHDYALTLHAWRERFQNHLPELRALGCDEVFSRMWR